MATATATDKKGMKRICPSCSTRYYDFNKRPIVCPNCKAEFTADVKAKVRRRSAANDFEDEGQVSEDTANKKARASSDDEDEDVVEAEEGVVSLEDAEAEVETDDDEAVVLDEDDADLDEDDFDEDEDDFDEDEDEEEDAPADDTEAAAKPKKKR